MNITEADMLNAAAPRSDQINADDLMAGPRTVTIDDIRKGSSEQPIEIVTAEFGTGRPYRPGKSMMRVLMAAWGSDGTKYKGRQLTIYRDPDITFGRDKVGGIRISAMSHIEKRLTVSLTVTRGKRAPFVVEPLTIAAAKADPEPDYAAVEQWSATTSNIDGLHSAVERMSKYDNDRAKSAVAVVQARITELTTTKSED